MTAPSGSHIPLRMCVVCRVQKPKAELFRFVRQTDRQELLADAPGRLPGKGVYFCRSRLCLERLGKERRLRRMFVERLPSGALEEMLSSLNSREPGPAGGGADAGGKDVVR